MKAAIKKLVLLAPLAAIVTACGGAEDMKKVAKTKAAEIAGDVAAQVMEESSAGLHNKPVDVVQLTDNVYQARGIGNTHLIKTSEGNVLFYTGIAVQAAKQMKLLKEAAPGDISYIVLSHSHADHIGGTKFWAEDNT